MKIYLERYYKSNVTNIWFIKVVENMIQSEETDMNAIVGISFSLGAYRNRYKKISIKNIITKIIAMADNEVWSLGITEDDGGLDYIMSEIRLLDLYDFGFGDNNLLEITLTAKESKYLLDWFKRRLKGDYKNDEYRDFIEYFCKKLEEKQ